jgi:hypothetical protein
MSTPGRVAAWDNRPSAGEPDRTDVGAVWWRLIPTWPLVAGLLVFGRLLAARMALLHDPDTYLHIAAGRWILAHGALPVHDPLSHSMPGAFWATPEWLAEVVLAATYDHLGWGGVIVLTAGCVALTAMLLMHFLLRRFPPLPALVVVALSVALLEPHCLARPHILALPVLALWSALLLRARDDDRRPPFLALPLVALWANLHGSFLFAPALALFLAGEAVLYPGSCNRIQQVRRWAPFVLAAFAATLLTPHGVAGVLGPLRLLNMPALQTTFLEWRSADFRDAPELELFILGALFVGFTTRLRLPLPRLLLLLGLIHLTLKHVRHADLLAIVGPLAVAAPLGPGLHALLTTQPPSRLAAWLARLAVPASLPAMVVAALVAVALAIPTMLTPIDRGDDAVTPASALAAAERLGLSGPVYNSEGFGGYLVFRGVKTFIDGRAEMYGNDFLAAAFAAEKGDKATLDRLLTQYHIGWALLMPQCGAALALGREPGWQRVYADDYAVVYRRAAAFGQ